MRIEAWSIEGFGALKDYEIPSLPSNITVFLGPNEAGKSTLLDFIRIMLFDRKGKDDDRTPVPDGRYGGTIEISSSEDERLVIRRSFNPKAAARFSGANDEDRT